MKFVAVICLLVSASISNASTSVTSSACLAKVGQSALLAFLSQPIGSGFRSVRLGTYNEQGRGSEKDSPYRVEGRTILVTVSSSQAMYSTDSQDKEIINSYVFLVKVLDAKTCKLGKAQDVTPE